MKRIILLAAVLFCNALISKSQTLPYQDSSLPIEERVEDLLSRMTLEEKIAQMGHIHSKHYDNDGKADLAKLRNSINGMSRGCMEAFPYSLQQYVDAVYDIQKEMVSGTRLGIPVIPVVEGLHGVVQDGCTIYPQAIAQGATFNPELIEEMAFQIAREARSIGAWQVLSPCLDVARELRWGRVEETFGEDPYMNAVNGTAYVRGAQKGGLICTPKHFVAHGTPTGGVNLASVAGGLYDLYNVYLPPFKMIIDECAPLSIMNCYSSYDGEVITGSRFYLNDLLRGTLGFKGYVYSDWGSIGMLRYFHKVAADASEAARMAIEAGLDLEASSVEYDTAAELVKNGRLDEKYIDEAVRNVLYAKFRSGVFDSPLPDRSAWKTTIHNLESVELSRKMAVESAVLLENKDKMLPLDAGSLKSIAVIGPNAARVQFGDYSWGADVEYGVTPLEGIEAIAEGRFQIEYAEGCDLWSQNMSGFKEAVKVARKSDVAVVFVGSQSALLARKSEPATSGEGYDLSSLKLPGVQEELIDAVAATGTPVIVVLVTGKPFELIRIREKVEAVVVQWYAGEEQGSAIAELLFGRENFSGRLPVSFPKSVGQLPCYYNWMPTDKGYYNRKGSIGKPGRDYVFSDPYALYDFGYGLSYSSFEYTGMQADYSNGMVKVCVKVKNASDRAGMETVQIYSNDVASSRVTPAKKLVAYKKVEIQPGEEKVVDFSIPADRLGFYDNSYRLCLESGDFKIMAGSSSKDIHFTSVITIGEGSATEASYAKEGSDSQSVGSEVAMTLTVRDIQASVLEGVAVNFNGAVIATTTAEGTCKIKIPSGAVMTLIKEGYDTLTVKAETESRMSVTMVPAF